MQLKHWSFVLAILAAVPGLSQARDTKLMLDFHTVVVDATEEGRLDGSVKFYLAGEKVPGKSSPLTEVVTNKKTNAFNKSDQEACSWVLKSALIELQESAKQAGANAVVDISSFYKRNEMRDSKNYECHAGAFVAGVALKGKLAKVK
ncbi:excinuclease [Pseudomonas sp. EL_65y_Pfl2_R95]|uniref:excinuclease n=1 Tax=Pseudomonas sp. EL_65y_Pfl2_R95 TaxID=3088698 RepID=UPI0030D6CF9A